MFSTLLSAQELTASQDQLELGRMILEFQAADQSYAIPASLVQRVIPFDPTRTIEAEQDWAHFKYQTDHGDLPVIVFNRIAKIGESETKAKASIVVFHPQTDNVSGHWGMLVDNLHAAPSFDELRDGDIPKGLNGSTHLVAGTAVIDGRDIPLLRDPSDILR
ncbi:chemotaxis protein CheW [Wenzhouxiangella limi]|uniref:CheW-like domain-containing protein n=1 Tax=Wenzhouxiangella limi TaxID=2707351 RepID=A0A845V7D9_9GAMM|nr:chemotaxis protein CheW [Wenzhouxiangella limi]NDY95865.1 hypothetical protein [Wenzhouxiangella limi]